MTSAPILLASASPRRRELLSLLGLPFSIRAASLDEEQLPGEPPDRYAARTARAKAIALAPYAEPGQLVLAADTVVALDGQVLGKPGDEDEARAMLNTLAGQWHTVYTAVALMKTENGQLEETLCASQVRMRPLSSAEIDAYIASGDPFDKAGGYAIQNAEFKLVDDFCGCYTNIIGLPLCAVNDVLQRCGMSLPLDFTPDNDPTLSHPCPVCRALLAA